MFDYELTQYDEFPVHQSSRPFSYIPSTDYSWDDGYYFGVFSPEDGVFLACGMRVNPNTDMAGGYALLNVRGRQFNLRFSRAWRRDVSMKVGPFRIEIVEPLKTLRLQLDENESGLRFDILWQGTAPAFVEKHHLALRRGRRTTDQTRYSQPGRCSGSITLGEQNWTVTPEKWGGARDHSWGLYAERPPLGPSPQWLPPVAQDGPRRALRLWSCFNAGGYSGFFHMHEDADGNQLDMNDVFGNAFEGHLQKGWSGTLITLGSAERRLDFHPGSRQLRAAEVDLTDAAGRIWKMRFETKSPPWLIQPMGYHPGGWKDGGTFFTYHGSEELALEWDDFDWSQQPVEYQPYGRETGEHGDGFGIYANYREPIYGPEYNAAITMTTPDGEILQGCGQLEMFVTPPYRPYGFE